MAVGQRDLKPELFPRAGNKGKREKRELANAVPYIVHSGGRVEKPSAQASALPDSGELLLRGGKKRSRAEEIQAAIVGIARKAAGRSPEPTYGTIDSQSVKAAASGEERGIHGGKKIRGRNRRIAAGAPGDIPAIAVHRANLRGTKAQPHGRKACG